MSDRAETGVMQFGDDWPGVFIRGDSAAAYSFALRDLLDSLTPVQDHNMMGLVAIKSLLGLLASSEVHPGQKPQKLKAWAECQPRIHIEPEPWACSNCGHMNKGSLSADCAGCGGEDK